MRWFSRREHEWAGQPSYNCSTGHNLGNDEADQDRSNPARWLPGRPGVLLQRRRGEEEKDQLARLRGDGNLREPASLFAESAFAA